MENKNLIEYYNEGSIKIDYDRQKEGYRLSLRDSNYFVDRSSFQNITNHKGFDLLDVLTTYNQMIPFALKRHKIFPSSLERAFLEVRKREKQEFEEFKRANNL